MTSRNSRSKARNKRNAPARQCTPAPAGNANAPAGVGDRIGESPQRLRSALAGAPASVFSQDHELRYTWIHDPTPGFREEDYIGRTDVETLPLEEARGVLDLKRRVLSEGLPARQQFRSRRAGSEAWYDLSVNPLRDEKGRIVGVTGVRWDITRLKKAEEEVQRQHNVLRALLAASPDILALKDRDLVLRAASPALCKALGRTEAEIVGHRDEDFVGADEAARYRREDESVLETGAALVSDISIETEQGPRWYQMIKTPVPGADGAPEGVLVSMRDISRRKESETAVRRSRERFRGLAETSQSLLCHCDLKGRFTFLNDFWETLLGYTNEEMLGRPFYEFCTSGTREADLAVFRRIVEDGEVVDNYETSAVSRDGKRVWFRFHGRPLRDEDGRVTGVQASVVNLTDRREAERRAETSEATLADIERLARGLRLTLDPAGKPNAGGPAAPRALDEARRLALLIERLAQSGISGSEDMDDSAGDDGDARVSA